MLPSRHREPTRRRARGVFQTSSERRGLEVRIESPVGSSSACSETDGWTDQFVIPGNILYKQRGTLWWPGENCIMGRDHTIHAMATGYVKYYRDPARHPDRKYIGVVF